MAPNVETTQNQSVSETGNVGCCLAVSPPESIRNNLQQLHLERCGATPEISTVALAVGHSVRRSDSHFQTKLACHLDKCECKAWRCSTDVDLC